MVTQSEFNFWVENNTGKTVEIVMELVSPICWDADINNPHVHNFTNLFDGGTISTTLNNQFIAFLGCWTLPLPSEYYRTFGLGCYKFIAKVNGVVKDYFYFDYRTSAIPIYFVSGDMTLVFDVSAGKLYYPNTQNEFPTFSTIWDQKSWIPATTDELLDFWENALLYVNDGNNHPRLIWGPYPEDIGIVQYKIYKHPDGSSWQLWQSVSYDQYDKIDESVYMAHSGGQAGAKVYYFVRGSYYDNILTETVSTDTIEVNTPNNQNGKINNRVFDSGDVFYLSQNYPNPFNPTTTISYSIKENGLVQLKVYDILGREVAELVNEKKPSGNYSVGFNAKNLSSGIYFYRLTSGNFSDTKELIIVK